MPASTASAKGGSGFQARGFRQLQGWGAVDAVVLSGKEGQMWREVKAPSPARGHQCTMTSSVHQLQPHSPAWPSPASSASFPANNRAGFAPCHRTRHQRVESIRRCRPPWVPPAQPVDPCGVGSCFVQVFQSWDCTEMRLVMQCSDWASEFGLGSLAQSGLETNCMPIAHAGQKMKLFGLGWG